MDSDNGKTVKDIRTLVEKMFVSIGFENENPEDLDKVTELYHIWSKDGNNGTYTDDQYILLNDDDVMNVLNKCRDYYEPKKKLSRAELRKILEDIATGSISRKDYDFKNGEEVSIEPSFGERISAIKMLNDDTDDNDDEMIQFINDIGYGGEE